MNKALFFPNYLGGGYGHIGRCLALAHTWKQQGGEAIFAINGPHTRRVKESGYKSYLLKTPRMGKPSRITPAYVRFDDMAYQIVRDGFDHPWVVKRTLKEAQQIVEEIKPDILIGDGWPLTWLVGLQTRLPVVQIVKSIAKPRPEKLVWWEPIPERSTAPDPRPVFNPIFEQLGFNPIVRAEDLLEGDLLLIPSIPELDPLTDTTPNTHYVGAIIPQSNITQSPVWIAQLDQSKPVVYVTVGGAAGHDGAGDFFRIMAEGLGKVEAQVIVSTGGKIDPANIPYASPNIRWESWVPTSIMLEYSDLVIFHGGYGTRMQVVEQGLPSIIIPFHSEQEYSGRQMSSNGAAALLHYSEEPYTTINAKWRGGRLFRKQNYSLHLRIRATLRPEKLQHAVEESLHHQNMRIKAQELQYELKSYGGCEQAVELIRSQLQ